MPQESPLQKSRVVARTVRIGGRNSGVSVEDAFWDAVKDIAAAEGTSLAGLVTTINRERQPANLSSAIRLFVLDYYRSRMRP
jgi:predicted DNA-binding ribbon-helix-helix protein